MRKFITFKNLVLMISILLNLYLGVKFGIDKLNEPSHNFGVLNDSVKVGLFGQPGVLFELPKGITVEDVAPRGFEAIGQFENERFAIIVTSDRDSLVDYNAEKGKIMPNGNYYSADYPVMEERK